MANNVSAFVPEFYSKKLLKESKEMTDFKNNMCNNDWEGEIKSAGDTVRISTPDLSMITIGEGIVPDTSNVYPKQLTLTIDKSKSFQFKFNDIEQAQSQFNMMDGYMSSANELMMIEVNKELEEAVLADSEVTSIGTVAAPYTFGASGDIVKAFNKIKRKLQENKALSPSGFYTFKGNQEQALQLAPVVTISPALFEELVNSDKLTHPTVQGDDILYKGIVGQIAGMKIFVDTLFSGLDVTDGASDAYTANEASRQYVVIAGTKMGITFAEQYNKVEKLRDPQSFADIGRALYLYGYKITNPKSLVKGVIKYSAS
jgi:hypothetical protein